MAKYQKYAEYKDSGLEWLGEIPSHWKIASLRFLVEAVSNGSTASQVEEYETTVPISRIESISTGEIDMNKVGFVDIKTISQNFKLHKNDILLSHINSLPMVGNIALKRDDSTLFHGMNLLRLVPNRTITAPYYLFWLLKSIYFRKSVESVAKPAINQASVSIDSLKNIKLLVPNIDEQIAIANFLDHETSKIDHLIEKQQQLIELLKEKRQAVISHAVTKGLNPNVSMKDSGVEWLGQVPEHWIITCLARISGIKRGSGYQNIEMDVAERETIQMLRIADMHEIAPALIVKNNEVIRYLVEEGDILVAGTGATAGISMLVPKECHGWVHSYNSIKVKVDPKKVNSSFLQLFLTSDYIKKSLDVSFVGSAQPFVDTNGLGRLRVLLPPLHEQIYIFDYLNIQTKKIDLLISKAQSQINFMQERRTALISAAVTGKIDVRNWQNPNNNNEAKTEFSA